MKIMTPIVEGLTAFLVKLLFSSSENTPKMPLSSQILGQ